MDALLQSSFLTAKPKLPMINGQGHGQDSIPHFIHFPPPTKFAPRRTELVSLRRRRRAAVADGKSSNLCSFL